MFRKILIANRGAIACRIVRTLDRMGVASVAVYSDADRHSLHASQASEAVHIGPSPAAQSYLDAEAVLDAARRTGAEAIHPGYGFLSENADFAEACARAGVVFIGPKPEHMRAFGLKHRAREAATAAGVPLAPGSGLIRDLGHAREEARRIGYPVMLKSTGGGGGIGLQLVAGEMELAPLYERVERLARNNFRDAGLFLEKYVARGRHIEVQVFGDGNGNVVTLGERDCSAQRRNQKVIEETPAPGLPDATRAALWDAARRLCGSVAYESAGTVEFLYDRDAHAFYFLEVNTRLQVEHGVTEEVTGVDLVEWMVRQAAGGSPLRSRRGQTHGSDPVTPRGASIQVRLYAEDPGQNFRPSAGLLTHVKWPDDARIETWVENGAEVSPFYDPMLAKIIVTGSDRDEALAKLRSALAATAIGGVETNLAYLRQLAASEILANGEMLTSTLAAFPYAAAAIDVLAPGTQTTIQDWPARIGYWAVGVPPSGPMDSLSFRFANVIVGNDPGAPALEITLSGPSLHFRADAVICLGGASLQARVGSRGVPFWRALQVSAGETLTLGTVKQAGVRAYLAVRGGFDVPEYLGSRSTFTLGGFGGHGGRSLVAGDVLHIGDQAGWVESEARNPATYDESWVSQEGSTQPTDAEPVDQSVPHSSPHCGEGLGVGVHPITEVHGAPHPIPPHEGEGAFVERRAPELHDFAGSIAGRHGARPQIANAWTIGVLYGPHGAPDFFTDEDIETFFAAEWEVHYNSSRTGVRLIGPKPKWARPDGGEAGLHPSNIHDNAYAVGAIDFTGDMPVILGPDGPSLGGFVCPAVVVQAELWKVGQLRPGDKVRFTRLSPDEASALEERQEAEIASCQSPLTRSETPRFLGVSERPLPGGERRQRPASPVALSRRQDALSPPGRGRFAATSAERSRTANRVRGQAEAIGDSSSRDCIVAVHDADGAKPRVVYRRSGDKHLLVEYGPLELNLELRLRVHVLMTRLEERRLEGVIDLTPGIRSLQVHYESRTPPLEALLAELAGIEDGIGDLGDIEVPSRIVHLPLSWDDPATRLAIDKYMQSVRADAPWCPSNIEFIRRINGLSSVEDVKRIVFEASYLVLGLGDVYLGAPVATPVDPRHRLVTTKYNPARTWTAENSVGIGGAYLCVYGMEGPGGYQFVGRTCQVWNTHKTTKEFKAGKPWLLRFFDQIRFYPVSADELTAFRDAFPHGKASLQIEPATFRLADYRAFLAENADGVRDFKARQQGAFEAERARWRAGDRVGESAAEADAPPEQPDALPPGAVAVASPAPGAIWKVTVRTGENVAAGQTLAIVESMKMEIAVTAPSDGVVAEVRCAEGRAVSLGQTLIVLAAGQAEAPQ